MTGTASPFALEVERIVHPHYGRFLRLVPNTLVELTWVTGPGGTRGAETVVTVQLSAADGGTRLELRHAGFPDAESRDQHEHAWPMVLSQMEQRLRDAGA